MQSEFSELRLLTSKIIALMCLIVSLLHRSTIAFSSLECARIAACEVPRSLILEVLCMTSSVKTLNLFLSAKIFVIN